MHKYFQPVPKAQQPGAAAAAAPPATAPAQPPAAAANLPHPQRPAAPSAPESTTAVSSIALETYLTLRDALTKGGATAQAVGATEEAFFKVNDLKAVALAHGLSHGSGKTRKVHARSYPSYISPTACCINRGHASDDVRKIF